MVSTMRMPMPPPPCTAFTMTGRPIFSTMAFASSGFTAPSEAGATGTPALMALRLALTLSPIASIAFEWGPMNLTPAFSVMRTKSLFSERKP
jgi:hypothetical protein